MTKWIKNKLRTILGRKYQQLAYTKSYVLTSTVELLINIGILSKKNHVHGQIALKDPLAQVFFGYFDLNPFSLDNKKILAHRLFYPNKNIDKGTQIEAGYYDINNLKKFNLLDITTAWSWQQASRLQWLNDDCVIYNIFSKDQYGAKIINLDNGSTDQLPMAIYCHNSSTALAIDFVRLERMRSGYGYIDIDDRTKNEAAPFNDGIWAIDINTKVKKLLISYKQLLEFRPMDEFKDSEHYLNHLVFSPNGERFLFFHIWSKGGKRKMRMYSSDLDGNLTLIYNEGHISHFCWLDDTQIFAFSTHKKTGSGFHFYEDIDHTKQVPTKVSHPKMQEDGHPYAIPNSPYILIDTYPNSFGIMTLYVYNQKTKKIKVVNKLFSPFSIRGNIRCDLHPRVSADGKMLSIDYIKDNKRQIKIVPIDLP